MAGIVKARRRLPIEERRHASSGPTPVTNRTASPIGIMTGLNHVSSTVILIPVNHSDKTGSIVPNSTAKHAATKSRLLNMKPLSRDAYDSSSFSVFR